jgi:hypothetical protein
LNTSTVYTHETVADRALIGTWLMDEVRMAVQKVYHVIEVYELYEYKVTQYKFQTGRGGLFAEYIITFLKLKTQANGYPSWVRTPEDEDRYIKSLKRAKAFFWIRMQSDITLRNVPGKTASEFYVGQTEREEKQSQNLDDLGAPRTPGIEVTNLMFDSDDVVSASRRFIAEEKIPSLRHTNEDLGAYVTSSARVHLYSYLDRLQEKAFYCDTDSVFYIQREDESMLIEFRDSLGDVTDELKPGEYISEFVNAGPKN